MTHKYIYADQKNQHEGQVDIYCRMIQETEIKCTEIGKPEQAGSFSRDTISQNGKTVSN